jgi:hypothetical protein
VSAGACDYCWQLQQTAELGILKGSLASAASVLHYCTTVTLTGVLEVPAVGVMDGAYRCFFCAAGNQGGSVADVVSLAVLCMLCQMRFKQSLAFPVQLLHTRQAARVLH